MRRKRRKRYKNDGRIVFKRVRALVVLAVLVVFIMNVVSVFNLKMAYSPMRTILPMASLGINKESVIDGYIYSDKSIKGTGPTIAKISGSDKKIKLKGYINPDPNKVGEGEPYILINAEKIFKDITGKKPIAVLQPYQDIANGYSDGSSFVVGDLESTFITLDNKLFIKSPISKSEIILKLVYINNGIAKSYDLGVKSTENKPSALYISGSVNLNETEEDKNMIYVSKTTRAYSGYTASLVSPKDKGIKCAYDNIQVDDKIMDSLVKLDKKATKAGHNLLFVSGFRSEEKQKTIYDSRFNALKAAGMTDEEATAKTSSEIMKPGYSEHMTGLAADIVTVERPSLSGFLGSKSAKWLGENAPKYGFVIRYPEGKTDITGVIYEPWHLRYLGAPYSKYLTAKGITYDEFIDIARNGVVVSDDSKSVYFIINNGSYEAFTAENPVNNGKKYRISESEYGYEIPLN